MKINRQVTLLAVSVVVFVVVPVVIAVPQFSKKLKSPWSDVRRHKSHLDHSPFFAKPFARPQDVTLACLECHPKAAEEVMGTAHWKWERKARVPGHTGLVDIGKKNLVNNFCIGIRGNMMTCSSCHAGYGWTDASFDFKKKENVDCLICHDWSGTYMKGNGGLPVKEVNLVTVAKSVGYPRRDNCGICHIYGGGGMGVKHGDLDQSLVNATEDLDAHMGKHDLLCIDCHRTKKHLIKGTAYSVSVDHTNGIGCTQCHPDAPHRDTRINSHLAAVACQTCHIPRYAKKNPTKTRWDWSKAGDASRKDDIHTYLKIKGEFVYDRNIVPEYFWFNLTIDRYLFGDRIDPTKVTHLNPPRGSITDPSAKIWPFKVHLARQHYDKVHNYILQPTTSGEGGYWHEFNWDKALRLGSKEIGLDYSGSYGFAQTDMHWPLSHMVAPAEKALQCGDCHGARSRMDWKALGYDDDPAVVGGRKALIASGKKRRAQ